MSYPVKPHVKPDDSTLLLEKEISELEKELVAAENELNAFESQIRLALHLQIKQIRYLTSLYKEQKAAKKAKRDEQKKKGKNYKEPKGLKAITSSKKSDQLSSDEQFQLKRLYKEAIVLVHPDKFARDEEEKTERAHAITQQLNAIYKSGDLDELSFFHEHIISGNAMSHTAYQPETIANEKAMIVFLQKKREELVQTLTEIKSSQLYNQLLQKTDPKEFIDQLRMQFEHRIIQLKKRTKS